MKLKPLFLSLVLLLIVACQSVESPPEPKPLLDQNKMVELISDLIILDATMSVNSNKLEEIKVIPNQFIFQKYALDSAQIAANLRYYNEEISQNKELYAQAKSRVEALKNNYDSIKTLKDSLRGTEIEKKQKK